MKDQCVLRSTDKRDLIIKIVEQIKAHFHPQKIILFGSYMWVILQNIAILICFLLWDTI